MFYVKHLVGLSSMVERRTLTPLILVRVKEPEPHKNKKTAHVSGRGAVNTPNQEITPYYLIHIYPIYPIHLYPRLQTAIYPQTKGYLMGRGRGGTPYAYGS